MIDHDFVELPNPESGEQPSGIFKNGILKDINTRLAIKEPLSGDVIECGEKLYALYIQRHLSPQIADLNVSRYLSTEIINVSGTVLAFDAPRLPANFDLVGNLQGTGELVKVRAWRFLNNRAGGGRGYYFTMPVKKWRLNL